MYQFYEECLKKDMRQKVLTGRTDVARTCLSDSINSPNRERVIRPDAVAVINQLLQVGCLYIQLQHSNSPIGGNMSMHLTASS